MKIALRLLRRRPGLAAGRLLTVTMIVAAVSSVFTVANATFLRAVPFPAANRLVQIFLLPPGRTDFASANPFTPLDFERFRERMSLERLEGIWPSVRAATGDGEPDAIPGGRVSAGFFRLFGGEPAIGRVFTEAEAAADSKLVVLSDGLWKRRYGGDPGVIGRVLVLDGQPHTIIGVMRAGFDPAFVPSSLWTPLTTRDPIARTQLSSVAAFGLLPSGHTRAGHMPEAERTLAELTREIPAILTGWTVGMKDFRDAQYGQQGPVVLMLLVAVAALGLIAISNLAWDPLESTCRHASLSIL